MLDKFEQPHANLKETLCNHEGLLGVVLGYGVHNAFLFHRRNEILQDYEWMEKIPKDLHSPTKPSEKFNTIDEELRFLWAHLNFCGEHHYSALIIGSIEFVEDRSYPETQELLQKLS